MRLLAFSILFCFSFAASSQNNSDLSHDEYLRLIDKIKSSIGSSETDNAFVLASQMEKSTKNEHKAYALSVKSYLFQIKGDSTASKKNNAFAFNFLKKVPEGAEKVKLNTYLLNYQGLSEWKRNDLNKALQSYKQGKKLSQDIGDIIQVIKFDNNIASIYADAKNYRLAIGTAKESDRLTDLNVHLYEKVKYNQSKSTVSYKLGTFYDREFFTKEKNQVLLDSAIYYYKRTLVYSDHTAVNNATAKLNLGKIYSYKGDFIQAEKMLLGLLKSNKEYLNDDTFKYLNVNLGDLYYKKKQYKEALMYLKKVDSAHYANSITPAPFYFSNYFQSKIYNALNEHQEALKHSKIFLDYYKTMETKLLEETIEVNFDIGKEEASKEILEIEKLNGRIILLRKVVIGLLILVVVLIIGFLIWKNNQKKKDNLKAMLLIEEFKRQIENNKTIPQNETIPQTEALPVIEALPKKDSFTLSIDEEKEDLIIKKLQELEDKLVFLNQDYTQQFVAKKIKTNTAYLSYVVNKRLGKSFSEYANELKLNYVINQLITNPTYRKYSTQAIAESAGFKKANSFTISFKKRTGLTPVQFAEKIESEYSV